jgi:hypothetical protein
VFVLIALFLVVVLALGHALAGIASPKTTTTCRHDPLFASQPADALQQQRSPLNTAFEAASASAGVDSRVSEWASWAAALCAPLASRRARREDQPEVISRASMFTSPCANEPSPGGSLSSRA